MAAWSERGAERWKLLRRDLRGTHSVQTPESLVKKILFFAGPVHFPVAETDSKQHIALNVPEFGLI